MTLGHLLHAPSFAVGTSRLDPPSRLERFAKSFDSHSFTILRKQALIASEWFLFLFHLCSQTAIGVNTCFRIEL